jgi:hypothetical protein
MANGNLKPVRGEHRPAEHERHTIRASEAFDQAWAHALEQARNEWGAPNEVRVEVKLEADIHIWNPGGIGVCVVTLSPVG